MRYFCGTSDKSDTSNTANLSDASETSAYVSRLSSYLKQPPKCITATGACEGQRGRGSSQKEKFVANLSRLLSGTLWLPLAPPDSL